MNEVGLEERVARAIFYHQGIRDGVKLYAHWHDGIEYVGTGGRTLHAALEEIDQSEKKEIAILSGHGGGR